MEAVTVPLRLLSNVSNSVYALAPSDSDHGVARRWGGGFQSEMGVIHEELGRSVGRSIAKCEYNPDTFNEICVAFWADVSYFFLQNLSLSVS